MRFFNLEWLLNSCRLTFLFFLPSSLFDEETTIIKMFLYEHDQIQLEFHWNLNMLFSSKMQIQKRLFKKYLNSIVLKLKFDVIEAVVQLFDDAIQTKDYLSKMFCSCFLPFILHCYKILLTFLILCFCNNCMDTAFICTEFKKAQSDSCFISQLYQI